MSKETRDRVMCGYLETLYRSPATDDGLGGTALVMFAIAAIGVLVGLLA